MSFKFKMQKVLDYRQQLEEEAKVRLGRAETELVKCRERLAMIREQLRAAETKSATEFMQSAERWLHEQYIKGLREDHKVVELQERMAAQVADEARKHLAACAVERKIMEKLKDKQKTQFIRAEQKQEQYFNDEIATIRYKAPAI